MLTDDERRTQEVLEGIELGVLDRDDIGDAVPHEMFEGACVWLHDDGAELCEITESGRAELNRLREKNESEVGNE